MTSLPSVGGLRDSGIGWIGLVPEGWTVVPAKAAFALRNQRSTRDDIHLTPSQRYGVIPQEEYMELTGNKVVLNLTAPDSMRHVEPNDFVIHLRSFQGGIEYSKYRGKVSPAYTVLTPRPGIIPDYFKWVLKSPMYVQALQTTTDQLRDGQSIKYSQFATVPLPLPRPEYQQAVANFLDRETAQIDAMIDAQQRLVDLLDERRTSTVQRVASGRELPPDVSSETWELRPVKAFGVSQSGAGFPLDDQGDPSQELPFYKVGSLAGADERGLLHSSDDTVDRETARRLRAAIIPPGSSVLAKIGAALLLGRIRQTSQDSCIDNNMMAFIPNSRIVPRFAYYSLQQIDTEYIVNPGAVPSLNVRAFMNTAIAVPDPETQRRVVAFLDDAVERVETLRARAESSISLLRERRAAVITAAVTGRLDPRTGG